MFYSIMYRVDCEIIIMNSTAVIRVKIVVVFENNNSYSYEMYYRLSFIFCFTLLFVYYYFLSDIVGLYINQLNLHGENSSLCIIIKTISISRLILTLIISYTFFNKLF